MTDEQRLQQFVQDVYLVRYNRFIDDITDEDGVLEINKTLRHVDMFLNELEGELDPDGQPIDWDFARTPNEELGTISTVDQVLALPTGVKRLVTDEQRPLVLVYDGTRVSAFDVVEADQITRNLQTSTTDRVTVVGNNLVFSRPFKDYEIGATVIADTIHTLPRLSNSPVNVALLDLVPYQLLVLGVAKNALLPDIVQGGLSPSFVQRYGDELNKAIAANNLSSTPDTTVYEDFSSIGGIY